MHYSGLLPFYPLVPRDGIQEGEDWVSGEARTVECGIDHIECWALFRSGQFVHNLAFEDPTVGTPVGSEAVSAASARHRLRVHVLHILETVTAAFELAARMATSGVLSLPLR